MKRNFTAVMAALMMAFAAVPVGMFPELGTTLTAHAYESVKEWGENNDGQATCTLDYDTGTLTISGTGILRSNGGIALNPFYRSPEVKKLVIESGITEIRNFSFDKMPALEEVVLPNTMKIIGDSAFVNCTSLKKINFPSSLERIGSSAFVGTGFGLYYNNEGIDPVYIDHWLIAAGKGTTIADGTVGIADNAKLYANELTLQSSLKYIGSDAVFQFSNSTFTIPSNVRKIYEHAFKLDNTYHPERIPATKLIVEKGVEYLGDEAFIGFTNISDLSLPASVKHVGRELVDTAVSKKFPNSTASTFLTSGSYKWVLGTDRNITYFAPPEGTVGIASDGVGYATSLEAAVLPDTVKYICNDAFHLCSKMTEFQTSDSLEIIEDGAFYACEKLTGMVIPVTVEYIGMNALYNSGIKEVTILNASCEIAYQKYCRTLGYQATIYGYDGSTAQEFAEKNEEKFVSLGAAPKYWILADVNGDKAINASDAANVLIAAAAIGAGKDSGLTADQKKAADVNSDTAINATDAAIVLQYAAAVGAGNKDAKIEDFIHKA